MESQSSEAFTDAHDAPAAASVSYAAGACQSIPAVRRKANKILEANNIAPTIQAAEARGQVEAEASEVEVAEVPAPEPPPDASAPVEASVFQACVADPDSPFAWNKDATPFVPGQIWVQQQVPTIAKAPAPPAPRLWGAATQVVPSAAKASAKVPTIAKAPAPPAPGLWGPATQVVPSAAKASAKVPTIAKAPAPPAPGLWGAATQVVPSAAKASAKVPTIAEAPAPPAPGLWGPATQDERMNCTPNLSKELRKVGATQERILHEVAMVRSMLEACVRLEALRLKLCCLTSLQRLHRLHGHCVVARESACCCVDESRFKGGVAGVRNSLLLL
ncbi:unnamed protein product [Symbiodinium natans]|uniref:Uncharacterized protein n=1 Tax=Symbiodinium natans TaxID=878477 RepID=A0A812IEW5_9DINO|nr:unnamed protein product [Symbiodinium natans]